MTEPEEWEDSLNPDERDPEAPPEDALEQAIPANPADRADPVRRGPEVGEWDAIEQSRVVDLDEEY